MSTYGKFHVIWIFLQIIESLFFLKTFLCVSYVPYFIFILLLLLQWLEDVKNVQLLGSFENYFSDNCLTNVATVKNLTLGVKLAILKCPTTKET